MVGTLRSRHTVQAVVTRRRFILSPEIPNERDTAGIFQRAEVNVCIERGVWPQMMENV
jgi:hypothetical protein